MWVKKSSFESLFTLSSNSRLTEIGSNYAHPEFVTSTKGVVFVPVIAKKDIFVEDVKGLLNLNCKTMDKASLERVVIGIKIRHYFRPLIFYLN